MVGWSSAAMVAASSAKHMGPRDRDRDRGRRQIAGHEDDMRQTARRGRRQIAGQIAVYVA